MAQEELDPALAAELALGDRARADLCAVLDAADPAEPLHDPESPA